MDFPVPSADPTALAASAAHWWALAGLDVAVTDDPRDWLARPRPAPTPPPVAAVEAEPPRVAPIATAPVQTSAAAMPGDLDGFLHWLAHDQGQPEAAFSQSRILPRAVAGADILLVTDMPTQEDMAAGTLLSGPDASLIAAMLSAVGAPMDRTATASLLLARPAGGIIEEPLLQQTAPRLRHFIRLLAPRAVILLGDKTNRAMEQTNGTDASLFTQAVNPEDGTICVMPLPAPFVLLKHAERKAAAWVQLRHLAKR